MSWAEDEGIDAWCDHDMVPRQVQSWRYGVHTDKQGKNYKIVEMTDEHLLNTLKYFVDKYDTSVLESEIRRRGLDVELQEIQYN